jgi:hypothetical protein
MPEPWNKGKRGLQIPWNKGKTGLQSAWNKGRTGIYSEDTRRRIGEAASKRNKGKKHSRIHKKRISIAMRRIKLCDQCSMKSKWIYGVIIKQIGDYMIHLCDSCLLDQYRNVKNNKKIEVVE